MSDATANATSEQLYPGFLDKLSLWAAWLGAGSFFFSIGWSVMSPTDPQGAVSLLARSSSLVMLAQACVLVALTATFATLLAGRLLPDAGVFAVCVGLITVSVRGETAAYFLIRRAEVSEGLGSLSLSLAGETIAWFAIVVVAILVCHLLTAAMPRATMGVGRHYLTQIPSSFDLFRKNISPSKSPEAVLTPVAAGILHGAIVAVVGLVAFMILSSGLNTRSIQHGQACFVVGAAICAGCYVAHRISPVTSAIWAVGGALVLAVVGYCWSALGNDVASLPATVPSSPFLRILPIQYAATGSAVAVAMCWYMRDPHYSGAMEAVAETSVKRAIASGR